MRCMWWGRIVVPNIPHGMNNSWELLFTAVQYLRNNSDDDMHVQYVLWLFYVQYVHVSYKYTY